MDSDLIRKADVQKILKALYDNRQYSDVTSTLFVAMENIHDLPTVDAVEVVRCENCEYFMEDIFKRTVCNRTFDMFVMKANDFCSYGKRKIGGEK